MGLEEEKNGRDYSLRYLMAGAGTRLDSKCQIDTMDNDERITRLEERYERFSVQTRQELHSIDVRLTRIESNMSTKSDLDRAINSVVKWVVGTILGSGIAAVTIMTFVLNNAVPKQVPALITAPVVIQLPPGSQVVPRP
jgi:hypothetical protein